MDKMGGADTVVVVLELPYNLCGLAGGVLPSCNGQLIPSLARFMRPFPKHIRARN